MVTIRISLNRLKKLNSCSNVKLSSLFIRKRKQSDAHSSLLCPGFPLFPGISLDSMFRPIPSILRFNSHHFPINFKKCNRVSNNRPCSPLDKLVNSVHSRYNKKISRLNFCVIKVNNNIFSFSPLIGISV